MANWVAIAEATTHSEYSHDHIKWLVRNKKIEGRKSGTLWLVNLDSLKAYEARMKQLGPQKFDPTRDNSSI
jgi:hypothetical protein